MAPVSKALGDHHQLVAFVSFYEHHGFRAIPVTVRLTQKLSDVATALCN